MDNYNYNVNNNQNNVPDNNQNNNPYNNQYNGWQPVKQTDSFALASLLVGIAAIFTSFVFYISIPCSVVAVVLACISKNRKGRFEGKAIAGLCIGISAFIVTLFIFAMVLKMLNSPELIDALNQFYNNY